MNKVFDRIPADAIEALQRHEWLGNVRELENFVHRAVIKSTAPNLRIPFDELRKTAECDGTMPTRTLAEAERAHIIDVLQRAGGVVGGRNGAAPASAWLTRPCYIGCESSASAMQRANRDSETPGIS